MEKMTRLMIGLVGFILVFATSDKTPMLLIALIGGSYSLIKIYIMLIQEFRFFDKTISFEY